MKTKHKTNQTNYISYILKYQQNRVAIAPNIALLRDMTHFDPRPRPDSLPGPDRRSAEFRYAKRIRKELIRQCGGQPTATQWLLIDRIASVSLRIRLMDCVPAGQTGRDYLDLTQTLAQLLAQLGVQPAASTSPIMPCPQREAAA